MRTYRQIVTLTLVVVALTAVPAIALAQPAAAQSSTSSSSHGIGIGVKGGVTFASLSEQDASDAFKSRAGWIAGLFLGGNRHGIVGVGADILYARKGARNPDDVKEKLDLDYINVPVYVRINLGTSNINVGASVYAVAGADLNFLMKAKVNTGGDDLTDDFERADYGFVLGLGVEVSRLVIEGRYSKGLGNIAKNKSDPELKTQTFAVMAGLRFN